ncbi:MAG TPA: glycosyltransferase [Chitinophagales bacterium]|nr:glycosyltransferase [Chitinophagales bacterium]
MSRNIFVFVVCGNREHVDALHYSLQALRRFSRNEIIVVTDASRNEIPVVHEKIVNFRTPRNFDHHQASIYLKTRLNRLLPRGNNYCYLDTDVVAVDDHVDSIFEHFHAPVTFAPDHCVMDQFSPYAMKCNCAKEFAAWEKEMKQLLVRYKNAVRVPENTVKKEKLQNRLKEIKKDKWRYRLISLKYNLSPNVFKLDDDTFLNKKERVWHDKDGVPIIYQTETPTLEEVIESNSPYRYDRNGKTWRIQGKDVFDCRCTHLQEGIKDTFGIEINDAQWHHWNGGVFLFNELSHDFLDAWHENTMKIFSLPNWNTRDQGTLIATVWQKNLQHQPTLPIEFNLIADYNNQSIRHKGNLCFDISEHQREVKPHFVHVYHHWADKNWDTWQDVEKRTGIAFQQESHAINSLWIGKELSAIELLTIHSFLARGHQFILWLYDEVETELPPGVKTADASTIIPASKVFSYVYSDQYGHGKGSYAGFSDIFRYKLLYEHGGWWVDMDICCLKQFNFVKPYFFRSHHELKVVGNVMRCPPGSTLMRDCYEEAIATIDRNNTNWHKPIDILNKHIAAHHLESYIVSDVSNDDRWEETSEFIWTYREIPAHWYFIHWQNEEWRHRAISKNGFYHLSTLADLMVQYHVYEKPVKRFDRWRNEICYGKSWQRLWQLFNP